MHRFFLPPDAGVGFNSLLRLEEREAHHASQVLRLHVGAFVTVLDGAGHEYQCEIKELAKREMFLRVLDKKFHPPPAARLTLVQAVPKGKAFELIIQKATELGAHRIVPLLTERVVTRFDDGDDAAHKAGKWQQIAIESVKQCGSPWLPEISRPVALEAFLKSRETFDLGFIGALMGERLHPRHFIERFIERHGRPPGTLAAWVGPEGDFTPEELATIIAHGTQPVTLGPNVLRADTAAIYFLSVLGYELQSRAP